MVAAVYTLASAPLLRNDHKKLTDNVSHAGVPTFFAEASCRNRSYTDRMRGGAGRVFGRANEAPMRALRDGESLDIAGKGSF